ncbi:MAG: lytic murein transglycosylase B [Oceanospirillaceae bacterium]|nr:lytic murein transglycosylase B [Oceanospirillaceae bacterium]|tara:strand:+ start:33345 stop:34301 length:957 start_codon:yes stop_codon:yes gene_type:complete
MLRTVSAVALLALSTHAAAGYDTHPRFAEFAKEVNEEYQIPEAEVRQWLAQAEKMQSVLDAIARPAEKTHTWATYQDIFLTEKRIAGGHEFMEKYADILAEAEAKYGVPKEIITAIIGVETFYGTRQGGYRVLDSLSTLAFDYPERPIFWRELKALFALAEAEQVDPATVKGSYAGAMGFGQFIPTSYLAYAVDGDGDGKRDLWNNPTDAIHSVANYFSKHGWKTGEPVTQRVTVTGENWKELANKSRSPDWTVSQLTQAGVGLSTPVSPEKPATLVHLEGKQGDEYWLGEYNFYVITRYNHSRLYAMAVYQLSESFK